jgi:hypothetical protein
MTLQSFNIVSVNQELDPGEETAVLDYVLIAGTRREGEATLFFTETPSEAPLPELRFSYDPSISDLAL